MALTRPLALLDAGFVDVALTIPGALVDAALKPTGTAALMIGVLQVLLTALLLKRKPSWRSWPRPRPTSVALMRPSVLCTAAQRPTGTAALMVGVLQLLLTAPS